MHGHPGKSTQNHNTYDHSSFACSVLLWRRSDNVCFALILGGAHNVTAGDRVECRLKGILQVRLKPSWLTEGMLGTAICIICDRF